MGLARRGGCLLEVLGITRLSQLEIDDDKDWRGYGISNIKGVSLAMSKGDLPIGGSVDRLAPGTAGRPLTSQGAGNTPSWG
jgi:hypothetical protein